MRPRRDQLWNMSLRFENAEQIALLLRAHLQGKIFTKVSSREDYPSRMHPVIGITLDSSREDGGITILKHKVTPDSPTGGALTIHTKRGGEWRFGMIREGEEKTHHLHAVFSFHDDWIRIEHPILSGSSEGSIYESIVTEYILLIVQGDLASSTDPIVLSDGEAVSVGLD